jgi:hypothetical protein
MPTTHGRRLGIIGAAMVNARRNKFTLDAMRQVRDDIEAEMDKCNYLGGAKFDWVTIAINYGLVDAEKPVYGRINKEFGDLPLSIEIDFQQIERQELPIVEKVFKKATLVALIHAGKRYDRPVAPLEALLSELIQQ